MTGGRSARAVHPRLQVVMIAVAVAITATQLDVLVGNLWLSVADRLDGNRFARSQEFPPRVVLDLALLAFGVLLVASHPRRSGITLGSTTHLRKVVAVVGIIVGGTLVYRFVIDGSAFDDWTADWSIWVISPIAQELVFSGFILGLLNEQFPRWRHPSLPITTAVLISAALFSLWHFIPDFIFARRDLDYVIFRVLYTGGGWLLYAMTRLWTGTILYAVAMHVAVNFIALGT